MIRSIRQPARRGRSGAPPFEIEDVERQILQPAGADEAHREALDVAGVEAVVEGDLGPAEAGVVVADGAAEEAGGPASDVAEGGLGHRVADLEGREGARFIPGLVMEPHGVSGVVGREEALLREGLADPQRAVGVLAILPGPAREAAVDMEAPAEHRQDLLLVALPVFADEEALLAREVDCGREVGLQDHESGLRQGDHRLLFRTAWRRAGDQQPPLLPQEAPCRLEEGGVRSAENHRVQARFGDPGRAEEVARRGDRVAGGGELSSGRLGVRTDHQYASRRGEQGGQGSQIGEVGQRRRVPSDDLILFSSSI